MNINKIEVDELPESCRECTMCIFDAEHGEDWCFAVDRHAPGNGRPSYCPLVVEQFHSRSEMRRVTIMRNAKRVEDDLRMVGGTD